MVEVNQDQAQALSNAYAELVKLTADDDHTKVSEVASKILEIDSSQRTETAQHAKLISLIKKREFVEAQ